MPAKLSVTVTIQQNQTVAEPFPMKRSSLRELSAKHDFIIEQSLTKTNMNNAIFY